MQHKARRKRLKKVKRIVAAMAGAAVMSSALLPVASAAPPVTSPTATAVTEKAPASSELTPTNPPVKEETKQATKESRNRTTERTPAKQGEFTAADSPVQAARQQADNHGIHAGWKDFSLEWRSQNDASVLVYDGHGKKEYRIRLTKDDDGKWSISSVVSLQDRDDSGTVITGNPVDVVRDNAARFGFDADNDRFSLLSKSSTKAIVQVHRPGGQTFKVDLERNHGEWIITTIRGIGSMKYPATYIPASMFPHNTVVASPVVAPENQQVLFSTTAYTDWTWQEKNFPSDMYFGIFTRDPRLSDSASVLPDAVVKALADIDYNQQLVFYANLGSVGYKGYGIGIEKVSQAGNTLFVTVRTKSPGLSTAGQTFTKAYDYISLDRKTIDFTKPVHVNFITPAGYAFSWYTFLPQ